MKNVLFASAALAAVVAIAAPAAAQEVNGFVGASYANTDVEGFEADTWAVDGSVVFATTETLNLQVDAGYGSTEFEGADSDDAYAATAHLFTRNDAWALGAFAGVSDSDSYTVWTVGAEGAAYVSEQMTLAGAITYANGEETSDDAWSVDGEARFFVTDSFRLNAGLGWTEAQDENIWNFGLGGEYQIGASPVSVYAAYDHAKFDEADIDADQIMVGIRYNFGGAGFVGEGALKARDRSGATF